MPKKRPPPPPITDAAKEACAALSAALADVCAQRLLAGVPEDVVMFALLQLAAGFCGRFDHHHHVQAHKTMGAFRDLYVSARSAEAAPNVPMSQETLENLSRLLMLQEMMQPEKTSVEPDLAKDAAKA